MGSECDTRDGTIALSKGWVQVQVDRATLPEIVVVACNPANPAVPGNGQVCHGQPVIDETRQKHCVDNFDGYFCESCKVGFYWDEDECLQCESGVAFEGLYIFVAVLVVAVGIGRYVCRRAVKVLSDAEKQAIKAILYGLWQPVRIMITYAQVNSQLSLILNIEWPPLLSRILKWFSFIDLWTLVLDFKCFGLGDFKHKWLMAVVIQPLAVATAVGLMYLCRRSAKARQTRLAK
jgi:hypothetical protein